MGETLMRIVLVTSLGLSVLGPSVAVAQDICPVMGQMAENIMVLRQQDASMSLVMEKLMATTTDPVAQGIIRAVIVDAYERPAFSSEEYRNNAIASFRNDVELECYKAGDGP
jgi:hypothetical protein